MNSCTSCNNNTLDAGTAKTCDECYRVDICAGCYGGGVRICPYCRMLKNNSCQSCGMTDLDYVCEQCVVGYCDNCVQEESKCDVCYYVSLHRINPVIHALCDECGTRCDMHYKDNKCPSCSNLVCDECYTTNGNGKCSDCRARAMPACNTCNAEMALDGT